MACIKQIGAIVVSGPCSPIAGGIDATELVVSLAAFRIHVFVVIIIGLLFLLLLISMLQVFQRF